ncbi:unnamed protein product [Vitrella brassicaformis CCMP3155]|uniref:BTB domain-containing protein n=2 Tax=Vitrella brassicaformis TaxID=1169539 RepID=A0A0G4EEM9_VITBC|nr:unnamed protein product [Vitrella brassicaformis CCMP3155]|mmetsp:Transcript_37154/g.93240  ORF Transcript_37154/g.93240 Transcript_37154/m.93240 type:complete len:534 (+) Transcript_37154:373-1974(+)|eukprot:CEL93851.1 unnamed protein product [Vitrella brassicaformis CCMP3155]
MQDPSLAAGPASQDRDSSAGISILSGQRRGRGGTETPSTYHNPPRRWREVELGPSSDVKPGERSGAASVVYNGALYVYGGYGGSGRLDDLWKFDFESRCWSKIEARNPPAGRENNGAVVYGSKMFLFGGYSGFNWLQDFHEFNFESNEWSPVNAKGNPPSTRFGYVSAVSEDGLFVVFGGYDGCTWLNDMYEFNFATHQWSITSAQGNIPSGRSCPSWATYKGSVFVFGGYDGVHRMNDFHQFQLLTRTWSPVRYSGHPPSPRYFHASVVYGDSLFLFGGYSGHERLNDLYEYRLDLHTWLMVDMDKPPSGRSSLVAQVSGNSLYVFGGYNGQFVLNDFHEFRFEPVAIPPSALVEDLKKLINNQMFADVTFVVENREVYGNRALLASRSEHFRALFYGGMKESCKVEAEPIPMPDVRYDIFLALLEYLYTDKVPVNLTSEDAVHLLIAAERFLLDRLKALCQDIIRKGISIDNVVSILLAANSHRADRLKEICLDFIKIHEDRLKQSDAFKELIQEPTLLYEIFMRKSNSSS